MKRKKNVKVGFKLSKDEIRELHEARKKLQGARHYALRNRMRAVLLVGGDCPLKHDKVAHKCKIHVRNLRKWLARYRESGIDRLKRKPVPGAPSKLTAQQKEELKQIVKEGPQAHGFDTGSWNSAMLRKLVAKKFDAKYCETGMHNLLNGLELSYKLPQKKLPEQAKSGERSGWM